MDFDILAMKFHAKELMRNTKPSPYGVSTVYTLLFFAWFVLWGIGMAQENGLLVFLAVIMSCAALLISAGFEWYCLKLTRGHSVGMNGLFVPFTERTWTLLIAAIIKYIAIAAMSMLFYVPGIIAFYWFRPLNFIIMDNPEMNAFSAIVRSIRMMKGHKLELFKVDITFLGWAILSTYTCWLSGIYSKPYKGITNSEFYEYLRAQEEMFG